MPEITWSQEDEEVLITAHRDMLRAETKSEVKTLSDRLKALPVGPKERNRERIGHAALHAIESARASRVTMESFGEPHMSRLVNCETLARPVFSLQSPQSESRTTFSLSDGAEETLEARARAGSLDGSKYPSSGEFILPLNTVTAWIGAPIAIPQHGTLMVLEVGIQLQIEQIWSSVSYPLPGKASDLLWVEHGNENLPLRGTAVAWCRAGLTLRGRNGAGSRKAIDFVSGWVNRDGMNQRVHAPEGLVRLSHTVAVSPELLVAGVFVDITCFAAAEESQTDASQSAYADLKCKRGDGFPVPSRLRLTPDQVRVRLCEMPLLRG